MAVLVAETNAKLRALLSLGLYAPDDAVWVLVPHEIYEGEFPTELGGPEPSQDPEAEPVLMKDRVYGVVRDEGTYVAVGRTGLSPKGVPTGNYQRLSDDEFSTWVSFFGVENFFVEVPQVESEVL